MDKEEQKLADWLFAMDGMDGQLGYAVKQIRRLRKRIAETNKLRADSQRDVQDLMAIVTHMKGARAEKPPPTPEGVWEGMLDAVHKATGISPESICGHRKFDEIVQVRRSIALVWYSFTGESTVEIGQRMGGRDHSTILAQLAKRRDILASGTCDTVIMDRAETAARDYLQTALGRNIEPQPSATS